MFICVNFDANVKVGLFVVVDAGVVGVIVVTWMQFPILHRAGGQINRLLYIAKNDKNG